VAQHDYVIANGTGAAVRSDLNNALAAIVSNNSGATEPATMYAYQWWADTSTGLLKLRNAANNAWITLRELDGTLTIEAGTVSAPGLAFASDLNTGIYSPNADQLGITTGGTVRLTTTTTGITSALPVDVPLGTDSAPTVTFTGDLNTGIYSPGADQVAITTNGVERVEWGTSEVVFNDGGANYDFRIEGDTNSSLFFVDASAEAVGIGTTAPGAQLHSSANVSDGTVYELLRLGGTHSGASGGGWKLTFNQTGDGSPEKAFLRTIYSGSWQTDLYTTTTSPLTFGTNSTERARIDSSGRLLVGTSTSRSVGTIQASIQAEGAGMLPSSLNLTNTANDTTGPSLRFGKVRSTSVVQNGDTLGSIAFCGHDGTDLDTPGAYVLAEVDGTPGSNDLPSRLVFSTTADGASSPTERMRISNGGVIGIGRTNLSLDGTVTGIALSPIGYAELSRESGAPMYVNRKTNDGDLVQFAQDNIGEGSISVSGTTVSYNGAHLSRWAQLPGGAEREEILRGTVLSNIDEMCEWGDEENEQLNRMKVSDVEGDPNVSGVFQAWDDDDDTYTDDFYCAMTGDFIIRIAEGVTVQRGDLLMSAGDGTAKPQVDDIIRSKTIAKVTSTHVTCTYDDGSYCVPCVLMAC
jgi:hypothetical protein